MYWLTQQLDALADQFLALLTSAVLGGIVSWGITHQYDQRSRRDEATREERFRADQQARDERQQTFLKRQARYFEWQLFLTGVDWWVTCSTASHIPRENWYCIVNNGSGRDVKHLQVQLFSEAHPEGAFLDHAYRDQQLQTPILPSTGENATIPTEPSWRIAKGGQLCFPIGELIDEAEWFRFWTEEDAGTNTSKKKLFPVSPFDSMPELRNKSKD